MFYGTKIGYCHGKCCHCQLISAVFSGIKCMHRFTLPKFFGIHIHNRHFSFKTCAGIYVPNISKIDRDVFTNASYGSMTDKNFFEKLESFRIAQIVFQKKRVKSACRFPKCSVPINKIRKILKLWSVNTEEARVNEKTVLFVNMIICQIFQKVKVFVNNLF